MSFWDERDIFTLVNSSIYNKTTNARFNNAKKYRTLKNNIWDEREAKWLFQKLPFYNTFIEKPRIKCFKNIDLQHELSFYNELKIKQISKAFKAMQEVNEIEIIDSIKS